MIWLKYPKTTIVTTVTTAGIIYDQFFVDHQQIRNRLKERIEKANRIEEMCTKATHQDRNPFMNHFLKCPNVKCTLNQTTYEEPEFTKEEQRILNDALEYKHSYPNLSKYVNKSRK